MKWFSLTFLLVAFLSLAAASPAPDFFKELERAGQRVRDAIASAGPAVDVVQRASDIWNQDRAQGDQH